MSLDADHPLITQITGELRLGPAAQAALRRPPFRLLHEIALQLSGPGDPFHGLFDAAEKDINQFRLQDDKHLSKNRKLLFIRKMVDAVHYAGGIAAVEPADAVTGRNVENTLKLLMVYPCSCIVQSEFVHSAFPRRRQHLCQGLPALPRQRNVLETPLLRSTSDCFELALIQPKVPQ